MATTLTAGDLRKILTANKAEWRIDERLKDADVIPTRALGADLTKVQNVSEVSRVDIKPFLSLDTANSFLRQVRVTSGYLKATSLLPQLEKDMSPSAPSSLAGHAIAEHPAVAGVAPAAGAIVGTTIGSPRLPACLPRWTGETGSAGPGLPRSKIRAAVNRAGCFPRWEWWKR